MCCAQCPADDRSILTQIRGVLQSSSHGRPRGCSLPSLTGAQQERRKASGRRRRKWGEDKEKMRKITKYLLGSGLCTIVLDIKGVLRCNVQRVGRFISAVFRVTWKIGRRAAQRLRRGFFSGVLSCSVVTDLPGPRSQRWAAWPNVGDRRPLARVPSFGYNPFVHSDRSLGGWHFRRGEQCAPLGS
jgi:hypothetical protein